MCHPRSGDIVPGVCVYLDDILITGRTTAEHVEHLDAVTTRGRNAVEGESVPTSYPPWSIWGTSSVQKELQTAESKVELQGTELEIEVEEPKGDELNGGEEFGDEVCSVIESDDRNIDNHFTTFSLLWLVDITKYYDLTIQPPSAAAESFLDFV